MYRHQLWRKLKGLQDPPDIPYGPSSKIQIQAEIDRIQALRIKVLSKPQKPDARIMYYLSKKKYEKVQKRKKYDALDECAICYDKLSDSQYNLTCGHIFHVRCIENMLFLHQNNKCPLCRRKFKYNSGLLTRNRKRKLKKKIIDKFTMDNGLVIATNMLVLYTIMMDNTYPVWRPNWLFKVVSAIQYHDEQDTEDKAENLSMTMLDLSGLCDDVIHIHNPFHRTRTYDFNDMFWKAYLAPD